MNQTFLYGEQPYSKSNKIKQTKGWQFSKEDSWDWDLSFHFFTCSRNWCMGSVIASGFEFFLNLGPFSLCYLNRFVITPPVAPKEAEGSAWQVKRFKL